jgi:16S rRNA (cytosine967-C5)-methyltransferase
VTPTARLQAAIEILDQLMASRAPADKALKTWGAGHRFAGSGDRRAIGERVYACLRQGAPTRGGRIMAAVSLIEDDGLELEAVQALFSGTAYGPPALSEEELATIATANDAATQLPDFLASELGRSFGKDWQAETKSLLQSRAPLDIRVNLAATFPVAVQAALADIGVKAEPGPLATAALRLAVGPDIQALDIFKEGAFEIQDEGSQIMAALCNVQPGQTVIDYCAGGGGKTLALAAALKGGRMIAFDIDDRRLAAIEPRLKRAGVVADLRKIGAKGDPVEDLKGAADRVLVDAPCSGSGTWRRHPEGAARLSADDLRRLSALQLRILADAGAFVKPGGVLAYVTCSVLAAENANVVARFAAKNPQFQPLSVADVAATCPGLTPLGRERVASLARGHQLQLSPRRTGTDGFFIALFERRP